ncbi:hypothetical protein Mrose_03575 [Calidithermus roseus]|uniref:CAAX prenyl protease 2/Lysostaphin resistance protein A-like domain-containing protein n=2 Tax=Calidithermus roseus TaxID=1644118 RepID=A0A399EB59_9DEIN|nr:hypothetical protein Mrose_03575 [Calidithermus roseus]
MDLRITARLRGLLTVFRQHPLAVLLIFIELILCMSLLNEVANSRANDRIHTQQWLAFFWYIAAFVGFMGLGSVRQLFTSPPSLKFVFKTGLLLIVSDLFLGSAEGAALASINKGSFLQTLIISPVVEEAGRASLIYAAPSLVANIIHSLVFSFAHSDSMPTNFLFWIIRTYNGFLFALLMTLVILRTGSVWNAILLHFLLNVTELTISIDFIPRHAFIVMSLIIGSLIALRLAAHVNNSRRP